MINIESRLTLSSVYSAAGLSQLEREQEAAVLNSFKFPMLFTSNKNTCINIQLTLIERQQINSVITTRYVLDREGAEKLLSDAETLEREAPDTVRFTRAIKDAVPYEERLGVIEALWSVVLADGVRADEEDALLRLVANLLGVNDKDSALARQRVAALT